MCVCAWWSVEGVGRRQPSTHTQQNKSLAVASSSSCVCRVFRLCWYEVELLVSSWSKEGLLEALVNSLSAYVVVNDIILSGRSMIHTEERDIDIDICFIGLHAIHKS